MNVQTAIKSGFQNYANFNGRASRSAYWFWQLFVMASTNLMPIISSTLGTIYMIGMIIPSIAVGWRRMHDINRAGWWALIPIVGFVFALKDSDPTMNAYGPPAPPQS